MTERKLRQPWKVPFRMVEANANVVEQLLIGINASSSARTSTVPNQVNRLDRNPETCKRGPQSDESPAMVAKSVDER